MHKTAYTVSELSRQEKVSRTSLYEQIAAGRLRARKRGRNTIILAEDWQAYLESLPDAIEAGAIRPSHKEAA